MSNPKLIKDEHWDRYSGLPNPMWYQYIRELENRQTAMQELFDNLETIDIAVPTGVKQIFLEKEKQQRIELLKWRETRFTKDAPLEYVLSEFEKLKKQ